MVQGRDRRPELGYKLALECRYKYFFLYKLYNKSKCMYRQSGFCGNILCHNIGGEGRGGGSVANQQVAGRVVFRQHTVSELPDALWNGGEWRQNIYFDDLTFITFIFNIESILEMRIEFLIYCQSYIGNTHIKKVCFLVVGPLRFFPPYTNGLVVHATFFFFLSYNGLKRTIFSFSSQFLG